MVVGRVAGLAVGRVVGLAVGRVVGRVGLVTDVLGFVAAGFPVLLSVDLLTAGRVDGLDSEPLIEDEPGLDVLEDLDTVDFDDPLDVVRDVDTVLDDVEPVVPLLVCAKASD